MGTTKDVRAAVEAELGFDAVLVAASMAHGVIDVRDNLQVTS